MCGIYGYISNNKNVLEAVSFHNQVNDSLAHRGPDDSTHYADKNIYLGHRRLSIIDVANSKQPMNSGNLRYWIIFNGEIYNYKELRQTLLSQGVYLKTQGDTEVILEMVSLFGMEKTLAALEGMFAFAIWDKIDEKLYLARDRTGEKTIYYATKNNQFVFASEIKALFYSKVINRKFDSRAMYEYFCRGNISGNKTFFEEAYEIEPGTCLVFEKKSFSFKISTYWSLVDSYKNRSVLDDYDQAKDKLLQLFTSSAKSRMLSDVPVGVLVSGGLDSSALVGTLAKSGFKNLVGFCAGNHEKKIDEAVFAEEMIQFSNKSFDANFSLNVSRPTNDELMKTVSHLTYIHDEPLIFPNSMALYLLCQQAQKVGMKVLLSGEGSDEIFCGYLRQNDFIKRIKNSDTSWETLSDELYFGGGLHSRNLVKKLCNISNQSQEIEAMGDCYQWLEKNKNIIPEDLILLFDQRYRLLTLNQRQDRMGMASKLELRQPYLNYHLFMFANELPLSFKFDMQSGIAKKILKETFKDVIPENIIQRVKTGFPTDFNLWVDSAKGIDEIYAMVASENSIAKNYLNFNVVQEIFDKHRETKCYSTLMTRFYFLEMVGAVDFESYFKKA